MADEALRATLAVVEVVESLGLEYLIGGSLASSLHGIPRSVQDADVLVEPTPGCVDELLAGLGDRFHVNQVLACEAVARRGSFNAIHLQSMFRVDLFVMGLDAASRAGMKRRERHRIGPTDDAVVWVAAAEDTVLQNLRWYRKGVSDRCWRDLLGVLRVQWPRLDRPYLERWAAELGLEDLLTDALREASRGSTS